MTQGGPGWIYLCLAIAAIGLGFVTYLLVREARTPRARWLRRGAILLGVLGFATVVVIAVVGPDRQCRDGEAYTTPGCA